MADQEEQLRALITDPKETLDLELKGWIDPSSADGIAKIAKGCMALRNNNGGHLIVGFTNTSQPDSGAPGNLRDRFHPDVIQGIVSKYSSELFAVDVHFVNRAGQDYPVVSVPPGIRTPVAAKADLVDGNGKFLIKDHAIYVRSLASNNTVSSTEARRGDWDRLIRICFDNREADIGAFVRRHLVGLRPETLLSFATALHPPPTAEDRIAEVLRVGRNASIPWQKSAA